MTIYTKTMSQALKEVYLGEDNMDLMKKAAGGAMQTIKFKDGKLKVDSFTASAIMAVYKAVNPKNKKSIEQMVNTGTKAQMMKLQSLAMKQIKSGDELEHDGEELDEGYSKKEIKMAIGIASDPRYKQGNYSGAVKAIEKIKKGLSQEKQVAAVLKKQNEEVELDEVFDFVLLDKDNKIVGRHSGKDAKKNAEFQKKSAHLAPMSASKSDIKKMKIVPISPKDKKDIGDTVLAIGEEVELDENFRKLAMKGIGTETKKGAKVGLKTDYYLPKNGDKSFGKIIRVSSSGYEIQDEKTKKIHKFKFYDPMNDPTSVRGTREEVELDEEVSVKDFDALKKGDTITVEYKSAMSSGKGTFTVTAKNKVAKGKVEKVTLKNVKNPGGVKHFLYKRDDKVSFAQGDMGASVVGFKKEESITEGTWALPDSPKLMAGLKKLMQKPIPLGKDGDDAINAIGKYIGDDGLYDDLYDAGKKDGPKADARPVISGWMDREFVGSWKKYRLVGMGRRHSTIESRTILERIDKKIQARKNG